jgi:Xaa-Pro aminopeptidase
MIASHLTDLRAELAKRGLHGMVVPRADEHLGEYVPAGAERLAWLTGFTGSAGLAVVLPERACLFVDGRYVLQAATQTDPAQWERRHITEEPPAAWLAATAPGARIGYDPWLISEETLQRLRDAGVDMVAAEPNPIDAVWHDRPGPPLAPAEPHVLAYAGRAGADKRADLAAVLAEAREDAAVITDPASIAWLLNVRGTDVPFTPFALGFALLRRDGAVDLFMDPRKLPAETRAWIGNGVALHDRAELPGVLDRLAGKRVRVDPANSPAWFAARLRAAGATVVAGMDPCLLPKASKNAVEQEGARAAHRRDALALSRFLHWLEGQDAKGQMGRMTEMEAAARLLALREALPLFRGESFPAISAAGEHGAIMHYRVSAESDRPIGRDELYLIDSGAQFADGTTDVTRTVWTGPGAPPEDVRDRFTRVLQGHIAIATLVFPRGVCGAHIDGFARRALWQSGLDFDHGTGHGVGSYLSVHEGPVSLSRLAKPVPLAAGMILSDEPGFYAPGQYGIRLENLVLVQPAERPLATKPFLCFETLTLAPFDRRLIAPDLLTPAERAWVDAYHARVLAEIGPALEQPVRDWLAQVCAPLSGA